MIIKLTDEKDLFVYYEQQEIKDMVGADPDLSLMIVGLSHMCTYSEEWNEKNIGNYMWFHFKK